MGDLKFRHVLLNHCCGQSMLQERCMLQRRYELLKLYSTRPADSGQHKSCCVCIDCYVATIDVDSKAECRLHK